MPIRLLRFPVTGAFLLVLLVAALASPATAQSSASPQDWALRACKNEAGARIADLPLSEISVEAATNDGEGNAVINWRTTRGSSGFCRVNRQGNIIQFKVEEMARTSGAGQMDGEEAGYAATCRTEAASRIGARPESIFVHVATRDANETDFVWRTRRGAAGVCSVDRRGRITQFEVHRQGDGGGSGTGGGAGSGGGSIPYAQRAAYDSGYSWGEDDVQQRRTRSYQRHSELYTPETEAMFRKGYDDGFYRRPKDYAGGGSGTGTGGGSTPTAPAVIQPGRYAIEFVVSGKVLDLRTEDGKTVQQWSGSFVINKKNQMWDIEDARNGYFYIRSAENGRALTARGSTNGSAVESDNLSNRREQQWRIKVLDSGEVIILSRLGPALDLPGGDKDNGVKPHLWQEHGRENQRFRLKPVS